MLLERIPTSTVSKNCLITLRTSSDLPVPARPTKNGHTCHESISFVRYSTRPMRHRSHIWTSLGHCWWFITESR
ncbi:hypothetical protein ATCV1_z069L [Acanthocystis turfacea chlorella virus 1]|uniref:Uncharacterized protein z069L n=1 Tax=Chlorovirus heliozoae TaxID=322019 RepID=A7K829_9PHYC|nr:hypothetical protein ATCV1_z069L [Acanthocystis turfacea chlorella virus 1]ABT16203.1 hypothetical protein ATCV1_z069L [Acanthocystis turfacea chlorella virus 1]